MIKNIIIDRGHGSLTKEGIYTTAPAKMHKYSNGEIAYEGFLNSNIARFVGSCLLAHPEFNVVYTVHPDDPRDLSLQYRVKVANSFSPKETIFVSLHSNASDSHLARGFEIFTTKGKTKSDDLAEEIAIAVESTYKKFDVKLRYDLSDGDKDKEVDFYVLRKTNCPAVLLENLFFDNYEDYKILKNPYFQGDLGSFIYTGILNYILKNQ